MSVVCAWCQQQISARLSGAIARSRGARPSRRRTPGHAAVSHGICPSCLRQRLARGSVRAA